MLLRLRDAGQDKIELVSGDLKLVDVGTVFEVARDGRTLGWSSARARWLPIPTARA